MRIPRSSAGLIVLLPAFACASARISVPSSPLELRAIQSKSYPGAEAKAVMKAVLGVLQDEGFVVRSADGELGVITASREAVRPVSDAAKVGRWALIVSTYGMWALLPGPKAGSSVIEATANVSESGAETRLRVSFLLKVIDGGRRLKEARPLDDGRLYQEFLGKVDKSLYLANEKLP